MLRVGVEHEYRLWRRGTQVDFRTMVGQLTPGLRNLDPGDPRARRLPSGVALTADGREAELATPPLDVDPATAHLIDDLLRAERTELLARARCEGVDALTGFSTHLNITAVDDAVVWLGRLFAESCLAALAEVMEPEQSSGMFVRPRRGRLEIGGEYAEGADLTAAVILLVACVETLARGQAPPPVAAPVLSASREKFGWFAAALPRGQLPVVWAWARPAAEARGLDVAVLDGLAAGLLPLRRDRDRDPGSCTFGGALPCMVRPDVGRRELGSGVLAETEWLTWAHVVWLFEHPQGRRCRAVVPVEREERFLADLAAGAYDEELGRLLRRPWRRRRLQGHAQLHDITWWHDLRPGALVPAERLGDGTVP